jgi:nucleoside-diphosphate-sugar epimerase
LKTLSKPSLLLTGASGFLGRILINHLSGNFKVNSLGRDASCDLRCDLSKEIPHVPDVQYVVHAAGKAHIYPRTAMEINSFELVNVNGTSNLLEALKENKICRLVFISSVAVYGLEEGWLLDEYSPLIGVSPYAQSKIKAEKLIKLFCEDLNIPYLILRLPLVVGPKPPGNLGKMMEAISRGHFVRIGGGTARKSAVLGADVAILINNWLLLDNVSSGIFNLTDGLHPSFLEWEMAIRRNIDFKYKQIWVPRVPHWLANILGKLGDLWQFFPLNSNTVFKMTKSCTFSDERARRLLGWKPRSVIDNLNIN